VLDFIKISAADFARQFVAELDKSGFIDSVYK